MDPEELTKRILSGILAIPTAAFAAASLIMGRLPLPSITGTVTITGQPLTLAVVAVSLVAGAPLLNALAPSGSRPKSAAALVALVAAFILMGIAVSAA